MCGVRKMKIHVKIQEKLRKEYVKKGYVVSVETSILLDFGRHYIVDVLAEKRNKKIIIEIGRVKENKLRTLKKMGYDVRIVPFHTINKDGSYSCACGYNWLPRVPKPKCCAGCKQRLD